MRNSIPTLQTVHRHQRVDTRLEFAFSGFGVAISCSGAALPWLPWCVSYETAGKDYRNVGRRISGEDKRKEAETNRSKLDTWNMLKCDYKHV